MWFTFERVASGSEAKHIRLTLSVGVSKIYYSWSLGCFIVFARDTYEQNIFSAPCSSFISLVWHKQAQSADDWYTVCRLKGGIEQKQSKSLFQTLLCGGALCFSFLSLMRSTAVACLSGAHAGFLKLHFLAATGAAPMVDPYWGGHIVIWLAGRLAEATEMHKVKWAGETDKCIKSANSSHFSAWFSCRVLCLPKTFSFGNKSRGSNCWFTGQDQKKTKNI